jgi:hypothetical protein
MSRANSEAPIETTAGKAGGLDIGAGLARDVAPSPAQRPGRTARPASALRCTASAPSCDRYHSSASSNASGRGSAGRIAPGAVLPAGARAGGRSPCRARTRSAARHRGHSRRGAPSPGPVSNELKRRSAGAREPRARRARIQATDRARKRLVRERRREPPQSVRASRVASDARQAPAPAPAPRPRAVPDDDRFALRSPLTLGHGDQTFRRCGGLPLPASRSPPCRLGPGHSERAINWE